MQRFCQREHIRLDLASVAHPQSNGQAKRANQELLRGIKPRLCVPLERTPGSWEEELPLVLWSIRTTPNRSTGYTPFFLVYGAEVVLPSDIHHDSPRVAAYVEVDNEKARQDALDVLYEERELVAAKSAIYQQDLRRYHSHRIITDNGTNLLEGVMQRFCQRDHIWLDLASVAHPQSNGQAERANQELLRGIKPRLCIPLQRTQAVGKRNYPQYYGAPGRLLTGQRATRPSSWSMEQKPFSRVTYVTTHLEWQHM